jgi:hypothetical protein
MKSLLSNAISEVKTKFQRRKFLKMSLNNTAYDVEN